MLIDRLQAPPGALHLPGWAINGLISCSLTPSTAVLNLDCVRSFVLVILCKTSVYHIITILSKL